MPADLLFEVGCEEVPAKMLARALAELPALVEAKLAAARLGHAGVRALGTPRRLAVIVKQLVDRQPDLNEEVVGPPVGAAFATDGALTKAGVGFAAKNGVEPSALVKREVAGKKGQYVVALRSVAGQPTRSLLPELLVDVARSIAWPKSQRWGWGETTFVRPVQWLVALFGGEVVPMSWAGATSGRHSRGHRFLAPGPVELASADGYVDALRAAHVVVDPELRRDLVRAELARLARETGLAVRPDDELLGEVIHLGEYPVGVCGQFDPSFLEVPEELIVTEMRNHQRYFAMEDRSGKLANRFATMMATVVRDPSVVQHGNEYVIASRLADAKFFFAEDKKKSFAQWNAKLDSVVFQAKLGEAANTVGHKVRRIRALVAALVDVASCDGAAALRAAELCKADLVSSAVGEFPELQGVMGRHYALHAGEAPAVAHAIEQHWWPKGQGAALPSSAEAALIAIADRIDTLVGCFATGLVPTGNADPLGLRRAAIAVLAILLDRGPGGAHEAAGWPASTRVLAELAAKVYRNQADLLASGTAVDPASPARPVDGLAVPEQALGLLRDFLKVRLRGLLVDDEAIDAQAVDVALGVNADNPCDVRARARALAVVPPPTRVVFKRIGNILDDARAKGFGEQRVVDETRLAAAVERELWAALRARSAELHGALDHKQYAAAFRLLAELGPPLAAFFDKGGVMVMDPNPELRENRLALLRSIYEPFQAIGDFRQLGGAA